jgi:signal peptidase II
VLLGVIAVLVFALDQTAKFFILQNLDVYDRVPVLGEVLQFYLVKNSGAAFSLLSGSTWIFAITASVVVVVIVLFARRIRSLGWATVFGLLLGGTTGNLYDRFFREPGFGVGHVVDYIQVWGFPAIFNIADIGITSAMGLFVLLTLRGVALDGTRVARRGAVKADAPE